MSAGENSREVLRQECWDRAIQTFGTAYLFEIRARRLQRRTRSLTFLGIVVPVTVGGIILSFGASPRVMPYILAIAGLLSIVQLIGSTWSLVARWDDALAYSLE